MLATNHSLLLHATFNNFSVFHKVLVCRSRILMWNKGQLKSDFRRRGKERGVVLLLWGFFLLLFFFQEAQYRFCFEVTRTPLLGTQLWLGWSCTCIFSHIICLNWLQFRPLALRRLSSTCSMHLYFCCLVVKSLSTIKHLCPWSRTCWSYGGCSEKKKCLNNLLYNEIKYIFGANSWLPVLWILLQF